MMKHLLLCLIILASVSAPLSPVYAQGAIGIAAVVDDTVITTQDVEDRIDLFMLSSGLPPSEETRLRLRPQIVQTLVEEVLRIKEAARRGISVSEAEIAQAVVAVERDNGKPEGSFRQYLREHDVPLSAAEKRLKAQIAWTKLMMGRVRPSITISDELVDDAILRMVNNRGYREWRIGEIFLPVTSAEEEENTRRLAEDLEEKIRGGGSFEALQQQFSARKNAAGARWTQEAELPEALQDVPARLTMNGVSAPVRSPAGYHLLKLYETRLLVKSAPEQSEVAFRQFLLPLPSQPSEEQTKEAERVIEMRYGEVGSCAGDAPSPLIASQLARSLISRLPPALQDIVMPLKVGQKSPVMRSQEGLRFFLICEKIEPGVLTPDREEVRERLLQQRMELESRRLLRDLERQAFIDIRV